MTLGIEQRAVIDRLIQNGARRTTERLEKMSGAKWGIMSSSIREVAPVKLLSSFDRSEGDCVGAHFQASSLVPLEFLITFSTEGANAIAKAVLKPYAERMKGLSDPLSLTIGEVSNFLAQSVVAVIADRVNVMIILKPAEVLIGRKVDLLSRAFNRYDGREDTLLVSQVDIYSKNLSAECGMVIIINSAMMRKLLATAP